MTGPRARTLPRVCTLCRKDFLAADAKPIVCYECKAKKHTCRCGCRELVVWNRQYVFGHATSDPKNLKVRNGHKLQGNAIRGSNNPAKRTEVRKKISEALMGRCVWQEGKTLDEIESTLERIKSGRNGDIHPYTDCNGNKVRTKFELQIANLLKVFCIDYQYEKTLRLKGKYRGRFVVPDFTLTSDKGYLRCLIEVTGSFYEEWRKATIQKIKRVRSSYPTLPIVIVTATISVDGLRELAQLPYVNVFSLGKVVKDKTKVRTLIVDSDHFNFDYSHFLPWHDGACADFHGHSSKIGVAVSGLVGSKGMVLDFANIKDVVRTVIKEVDHKVFVPDYALKRISGKTAYIRFVSKGRKHRLEIPASEVFKLPFDSTIENIAGVLGQKILDLLPWNVESVSVQVNEGIAKSAVCTVERSIANSHNISREPGKLLQVLHFYQMAPMWKESWGSCTEQTFTGKTGARLLKGNENDAG